MNFYLGGMRANTQYSVYHTVITGNQFQNGPPLTWTTQPVSLPLAGYSILTAPANPATEGIMLQRVLVQSREPAADCDNGRK